MLALTHLRHVRCAVVVSQVNLLLDRGADINVQNKLGWTPLHASAEKGHYDVVQRLVDAGADPSIEDGSKRTAWRIALLNKRERCVRPPVCSVPPLAPPLSHTTHTCPPPSREQVRQDSAWSLGRSTRR